ncbi:DUF4388 domain-containing protein [Pseudenhygromyxa sp. WMMC2535]|nr:DUF4388 domain-containing protein [Pseudenhygromyxa sp. WMMC2535]
MNSSSPLTLLVAADDPRDSASLTQMLRRLRPELRALSFTAVLGEGAPSLALVVEKSGPGFGRLCATVRSRFPGLPLVVIAPRFDGEAIAALAEVGPARLVPSPCEPAALMRAIDAHERRPHFEGRVSAIETSELLRLLAAAESSGVLHLRGCGGEGAIHIEAGQPVHAQVGERRGMEAVFELLRWGDASATWLPGHSAVARTIVGRVEGLLGVERSGSRRDLGAASRSVVDKIERLSRTDDILAAFLLRDGEIVTGGMEAGLDEALVSRALSRLAGVFFDMEELQGDFAGSDIQATVGEHRLVVDRLGPASLGFQVGVLVRQATPICKSLRRVLRQIDRSFRRALSDAEPSGGEAASIEAA